LCKPEIGLYYVGTRESICCSLFETERIRSFRFFLARGARNETEIAQMGNRGPAGFGEVHGAKNLRKSVLKPLK
jgi:hypothetical protein